MPASYTRVLFRAILSTIGERTQLVPRLERQHNFFGRQLFDGGVEDRLRRIVRGHVPVDRFDKARFMAVVHCSRPGQILDDFAVTLPAARRVRRRTEQGGDLPNASTSFGS